MNEFDVFWPISNAFLILGGKWGESGLIWTGPRLDLELGKTRVGLCTGSNSYSDSDFFGLRLDFFCFESSHTRYKLPSLSESLSHDKWYGVSNLSFCLYFCFYA